MKLFYGETTCGNNRCSEFERDITQVIIKQLRSKLLELSFQNK